MPNLLKIHKLLTLCRICLFTLCHEGQLLSEKLQAAFFFFFLLHIFTDVSSLASHLYTKETVLSQQMGEASFKKGKMRKN